MSHPLVDGSKDHQVGVISADNPRFRTRGDHEALVRDLRAMGLRHEEVRGQFGGLPERAVVVHGIDPESLIRLGQAYGQEAVIHHGGGHRWLAYTGGPRLGLAHPLVQAQAQAYPPEDGYLSLPGAGYVALGYDKDRLQHTGLAALHEQSRTAQPETMQKNCGGPQWAGSYPHHDGHTKHHHQQLGTGNLVEAALAKAEDQRAEGASSSAADVAGQFGAVAPGRHPDLKFYPLHGRLSQVQQLVAQHGFQPAYVGGQFGRPDPHARNFDTRHLQIHDPGHGVDLADRDYADAWRQSHELAHALTQPAANEIYGDGRRTGKLGQHRSLREAVRAVHWAHLAARKQRELLASIGVHLPEDAWHHELNTVMYDAVHRALNGRHAEPSYEGFWPHGPEVPLEQSLQLVRDHARKLGLAGDHDLLRKSETAVNPAILPQDQEKNLRSLKDIDKSVDRRTAALVALRKAELAYPGGPSEKCMICQHPAGKCRCLEDLHKAEVDRPCDVCGHNPCKCPGELPGKTKDETPAKSGAGGGVDPKKAKLAKDDVPMAKPPTGTKPPKPKLPHAPSMMAKVAAIEYGTSDAGQGVSTTPPPPPAPPTMAKSDSFAVTRTSRLDKIAEILAKGEIDSKVIESLAKSFLGGRDPASQAMTQHAAMSAPKTAPAAPATAPKLSSTDQARRAADLASFTPAGAFQASGKGSALGGAPKPAAPAAGAPKPAAPGKPMGTSAMPAPKLLDRFTSALKGGGMKKAEPDAEKGPTCPDCGVKVEKYAAHNRGQLCPACKKKFDQDTRDISHAATKVAGSHTHVRPPLKKGAEFGSMPMGSGSATTGGVGALNMSEAEADEMYKSAADYLKKSGMDPEMCKSAPPGWGEDAMHKLKAKVGEKRAFAVAWSQHKKGHDPKK